jgi:hypothetical protein
MTPLPKGKEDLVNSVVESSGLSFNSIAAQMLLLIQGDPRSASRSFLLEKIRLWLCLCAAAVRFLLVSRVIYNEVSPILYSKIKFQVCRRGSRGLTAP